VWSIPNAWESPNGEDSGRPLSLQSESEEYRRASRVSLCELIEAERWNALAVEVS
jgi:hypothetical protein